MPDEVHMDVDDRIASSGCEAEYRLLEECIVESNRDWRRCQVQVAALRKCMGTKSVTVGVNNQSQESIASATN